MPAKDQGFTEDQIEDFKEVFQLFDTKGDGLIQVHNIVNRFLGLIHNRSYPGLLPFIRT